MQRHVALVKVTRVVEVLVRMAIAMIVMMSAVKKNSVHKINVAAGPHD